MKSFKKGFTLVELLIVILIIGILATIAIISYSGASARAKRAATIEAINEAVKGIAVCAAGEGVPLATPASEQSVCGDTSLTSAKYPKVGSKVFNGYTITLPTAVSSTGVITGTFSAADGAVAITCTNNVCIAS